MIEALNFGNVIELSDNNKLIETIILQEVKSEDEEPIATRRPGPRKWVTGKWIRLWKINRWVRKWKPGHWKYLPIRR